MSQWSRYAHGVGLTLVIGLCVGIVTPAAAQQVADSGVAIAASPAPTVAAPLTGPRLASTVPSVRAPMVERTALAAAPAPPPPHTIVLSTLAIVLIAVIVTILVVK
jgi:hypothetical protein